MTKQINYPHPKKIFFVFLTALLFNLNAMAQWNSLNALSGTGTDTYGYNLLAVSDNGKNIASHTTKTIWSPFAISYVYVVSTDYGATWTEHPAPNSIPNQLFWSEDALYVAETNTTDLKKSADYGATFTTQYANLYNIGLAANIYRISPSNWIVTQKQGTIDHLMQSADKGFSWTDMGAINGFPVFFSHVVANNGNIISVTGGGVGYSNDNGLTWQNSTLPTTIQITNRHTFSKSSNGNLLMYVHLYGLFESQDNGVTWQTVTTSLPANASNCVYQGNDIICIATDASTYISSDNGITFTQLTAANQLYTANVMGSKILEKTAASLYTAGTNKIYIYGAAPSAVSNVANEIKITISPNPASNNISFDGFKNNEKVTLNIMSLDGKIVKEYTLTSSSLNVSDLNPGNYFIVLKAQHQNFSTTHFIKK